MTSRNRHSFNRFEFVDLGDPDAIGPIMRIQSQYRLIRGQVTQFHSAGERMHVNRGVMNRGIEWEIELRRDVGPIDVVPGNHGPVVGHSLRRHQHGRSIGRFNRHPFAATGADMVDPGFRHALRTHSGGGPIFALQNVERPSEQRFGWRARLVARDGVQTRAHPNVHRSSLRVQVQGHREIIERSVGWNRHTETGWQIDR